MTDAEKELRKLRVERAEQVNRLYNQIDRLTEQVASQHEEARLAIERAERAEKVADNLRENAELAIEYKANWNTCMGEIAALQDRLDLLRAAAEISGEDILEKVAEVQYQIWKHWMNYLFSCCKHGLDGSVVIPASKANRWKRQMEAGYDNLTEKEKDSDREQAQKVMLVLLPDGDEDDDCVFCGCEEDETCPCSCHKKDE